jgi:hypothetical protein
MGTKVGNAAQVVAELENKIAENEANAAIVDATEGEDEVEVEDTDENADAPAPPEEPKRTKTPKVALTVVILKLIADADFLLDEQKEQLKAAIDAVINKVTAKPSIKTEVKELIEKADPKVGISKNELFDALTPKHPDMHFMDLGVSLRSLLQPVFMKKGGQYGWTVEVLKSGNFAWVK